MRVKLVVITLCLKVFETCAPDLQVNGTLQATYKVGRKTRESCNENYFFDFFFQFSIFQGVLWTVSGNPVTAQSLAGVQIK